LRERDPAGAEWSLSGARNNVLRMEMLTFKCPYCQQEMSAAIGPNHTVIPDPTGRVHGVVVLSCVNEDCLKMLGAFPAPPQLAAASVPHR
jgi:hypothetical protein